MRWLNVIQLYDSTSSASALLRHLVSLWLGHVAVLIVHRTIIHCRADTPLTLRYLKGKALVDIPTSVGNDPAPGERRRSAKTRGKAPFALRVEPLVLKKRKRKPAFHLKCRHFVLY